MTKVLVLGDTHGVLETMNKIIELEKPNVIVHTGDYDNIDLKNDDPFHKTDRDTIKKILTYWTKGNHDFTVKYGFDKTEADFEEFITKAHRCFEIERVKIFLSHFVDDTRPEIYFGNGNKYVKTEKFKQWFMDLLNKENPKIVLTGHTHIAKYWHIDKYLCLNPGSLDKPKLPQTKGSYALLNIDKGEIISVEIKYLS